ncbi:hypothetical protein RPMD05_22 [Rhodobacteraceae phage LS06-2018-MD05]|nr:hypothetical protein RPMD05_22 [Rhodobacteraceae phage LS06-2018-MD05]
MKYFKNDIVEIITANYKSWNDIPNHERGYYKNQNEPAPTIGQRFRIKIIGDDRIYAEINGRMCLGVHPDCVMLVKRPLVNKVRSLYVR